MLWQLSCTASFTRGVEVTEYRVGLLAEWPRKEAVILSRGKKFLYFPEHLYRLWGPLSILSDPSPVIKQWGHEAHHIQYWASDLAMMIFIACSMCKILWFPSGSTVGVASSLGYVILRSMLFHLFLCKWSFLVYKISLHYFTMIFVTVLLFLS